MNYRAAYLKTFFDNMVMPYLVPEGMNVQVDQWYVLSTRFGDDLGQAVTGVSEVPADRFILKKNGPENGHEHEMEEPQGGDASNHGEPVLIEHLRVLKSASHAEVESWKGHRQEEREAYEKARAEIEELKLDMKLIHVHMLYQRKKIIFSFTAEARIDFRQLVKRLAGLFKTRIEMRQIGVRDAAKILGGYGVCGIKNCCMRSNCHMNSIYLKMAKDQGFVVNSSKLTGSCGRLMCCLAYEMDYYTSERKKFPEIGSLVMDNGKGMTVISHNLISGDVYVLDENHHQKKFPLSAFQWFKKDASAAAVYKLIQETSPEEPK